MKAGSEDVVRGEMCIATVNFDIDSEWADVQTINDALSAIGYGVTMASSNSHLIVTRDRQFKPEHFSCGGGR